MSESDPLNSFSDLDAWRERLEEAMPRPCLPRLDALYILRQYIVNINALLVFAPLGFLATRLGWGDVVISAFSFLTILPLCALISDASDLISNRWGSLIGGLLNATFGNIVEIIVGISAIGHDELGIAQSMMLGSILSDVLFVQGCCIIIAARGTGVISVNRAMVDVLSSLMLITSAALVLPTALYSTSSGGTGTIDIKKNILSFSRATAVVLLGIYVVYLYFQLRTHSSVFIEEGDDVDHVAYDDDRQTPPGGGSGQDRSNNEGQTEGEEDDETPSMRQVYTATAVLITSGVIIGQYTHYFMQSLDGMTEMLGISKTFVAIVILPIASNASEMSQVMAASHKKKISFAISVIIGSILQIALFVLPILVVIGWLMDRAMDLSFETSQIYILLLAVIAVNQVLQDKQYTYLHGVMLLSVYIIIAMAYFVEPYQ